MAAEAHGISHYIAPVVNFVTAFGLLAFATRKSIPEFFASRSKQIKENMSEAEKAYQEADLLLKEWSEKEKSAHTLIQTEKDEAQASMRRLEENTISEMKDQAKRIIAEGKNLQMGEVEKAKSNLTQKIVSESIQTAENFMGNSISKNDKTKLLNEYLEKLNNVTTA